MNLEIVRRIRDNLHGSIDVTELEDLVIAHQSFQRLRRIRQTAFLSLVFPGATHTRFEHSLGVMQLSGIAWQKLAANQRRMANNYEKIPDFENRESNTQGLLHGRLFPTFKLVNSLFDSQEALQALRLAGLMHDLGHPPFSHSGERFLPSWTEFLSGARDIPPHLADFIETKVENMRSAGKDPSKIKVRHELYTLLLIDKVLRDIYIQNPKLEIQIDPQDVMSIMTPDIPPSKNSSLRNHGLHSLCHELVSGEFDVDRMDYLLRDSREAGVVYGIFDRNRILDSLAIYADESDQLHIAINFSGLAAFEDYLRARYSMYLQLYFHKTSVAAEAMLQRLSKMIDGVTLPIDVDEYATIDEYNIAPRLLNMAADYLGYGAEYDDFEKLLNDVLFNRRLWKRVYEISSPHNDDASHIDKATKMLEGLPCNFEKVSSKGSMTNFLPRKKNQPSLNYLKLIKKDERLFPRVVPIEDYSSIINSSDRVSISRLYMAPELDADGLEKTVKATEALNASFSQSASTD